MEPSPSCRDFSQFRDQGAVTQAPREFVTPQFGPKVVVYAAANFADRKWVASLVSEEAIFLPIEGSSRKLNSKPPLKPARQKFQEANANVVSLMSVWTILRKFSLKLSKASAKTDNLHRIKVISDKMG